MKRFVSAILVPCLLLQLCGCYSAREISLYELQDMQEAVITTKDSLQFILKKKMNNWKAYQKPNMYFSNEWFMNPKTEMITLITQKTIPDKSGINSYQIIIDTSKVKYSEISKISVDEFDVESTFLYTGLTLVVIAGVLFLVFLLTFHYGPWS